MLTITELDCLEAPGLSVMLGHDAYPEGHQAGVTIVQHGVRVAANGDLRLERTPGQWSPVPRAFPREVDRDRQEVRQRLAFPDPGRDRQGFNPIRYPDLSLAYTVRLRPEGEGFRLRVDLDAPLPAAWVGRVAFHLELFPGLLFGRSWRLDEAFGHFPLQANGPGRLDAEGRFQIAPLATGRRLTVAPESDRQRMTIEHLGPGALELLDGRGQEAAGWFIVRAPVPAGMAAGAVEWRVTPHAIPGFRAAPVIQHSQVGYHPAQRKLAVVALDAGDTARPPARLLRVGEDGPVPVRALAPREWGRFLRYRCLTLDFSDERTPGMYQLAWGDAVSTPFRIAPDVYRRHVWQPTLEYFLPIQMCHVRVTDRSRVWHGACHLDDARMAPTDHLHFDGYAQGPSTLCRFGPGEHVPGLDRGGWHDAGDHDLRIESQLDTVHGLALAREAFGVDHDSITVDPVHRTVELGRPDGRPDILEQLEHGLLSALGGWRAMGRLYRGIIEPDLRQYTWIGDPSCVTDNQRYDPAAAPVPIGVPGAPDDRWVFTEEHPARELHAAAALAAAARALRGHDPALAAEALAAAVALWDRAAGDPVVPRTAAAVELLLASDDPGYARWLRDHRAAIVAEARATGWMVARVLGRLGDPALAAELEAALRAWRAELDAVLAETPYQVPYRPRVWGAAWSVQRWGVEAYHLHAAFPDLFEAELVFAALHFVLGRHPGADPASFVSGVGARSVTSAYGFQRAAGAHIPGGVVSGSALVRPDLVELHDWPYLWQQTEYVLGHGTADFLFLALAADRLLSGS